MSKKRKVKLVYTKHAKDRMATRRVSQKDVEDTLKNPTKTLPKDADNTQEFRRKDNGVEHFVVVEHRKNAMVIITVR
ncbi:MAG: DUF4258 domain-containing protein [Candidatus Omnitrophota bacterium]